MQTLFQRTETISKTIIPTTFYAQYFQEMSVVLRSILGKHLFSQCVIPHLPEFRRHWEVVSTVVSIEKCFKGLQEFCHLLLQTICTLDNRAQFKEISSAFSVSILEKIEFSNSKTAFLFFTSRCISVVFFFSQRCYFLSNSYLEVCLELVSSERSLLYLILPCLTPLVVELIPLTRGGLGDYTALIILCISVTLQARIAKCWNNLSTCETLLAYQSFSFPTRHQGTAQITGVMKL